MLLPNVEDVQLFSVVPKKGVDIWGNTGYN